MFLGALRATFLGFLEGKPKLRRVIVTPAAAAFTDYRRFAVEFRVTRLCVAVRPGQVFQSPPTTLKHTHQDD